MLKWSCAESQSDWKFPALKLSLSCRNQSDKPRDRLMTESPPRRLKESPPSKLKEGPSEQKWFSFMSILQQALVQQRYSVSYSVLQWHMET